MEDEAKCSCGGPMLPRERAAYRRCEACELAAAARFIGERTVGKIRALSGLGKFRRNDRQRGGREGLAYDVRAGRAMI